ncbi:MAG: hypothetical protein QM504_08145 [Pseudomonadota bacterium]
MAMTVIVKDTGKQLDNYDLIMEKSGLDPRMGFEDIGVQSDGTAVIFDKCGGFSYLPDEFKLVEVHEEVDENTVTDRDRYKYLRSFVLKDSDQDDYKPEWYYLHIDTDLFDDDLSDAFSGDEIAEITGNTTVDQDIDNMILHRRKQAGNQAV